MILIFDLDDTLYEERLFVESGLRAVADRGAAEFGIDAKRSFEQMRAILDAEGRGRIFDDWLDEHGMLSRQRVKDCVKTYRSHFPKIDLPADHRQILQDMKARYPLYLVTDGHKIAQSRKIDALNIASYFKRVFITHRFGIRHAKPSLYCFEKIRQAEDCDWSKLIYVGDNPAKDFVNLNTVGAVTIRIHTGAHATVKAKPNYDAQYHIDDLSELSAVLDKL